nr:hypothetical protein pEC1929_0010 [Escherichia coli]
MPAFEWVHVQLHQQKGMISLSPPTICNSAPRPAGTPAPTASLRTPGAARGRSRVRPARIPAMAGRREPTGKLSQ